MTRIDAHHLVDPGVRTGLQSITGEDAVTLCPFDLAGIAACPGNRPRPLAERHRSRVDCRYFRLRASPRGIVATCTRPAD